MSEEMDFSAHWLITLSVRTKVDSGPRRGRKDGDRGRGPRDRGRGRGRPEIIQSHSIFEQGPAELMVKKKGGSSAGSPHALFLWLCFYITMHNCVFSRFKWIPVSRTGGYENEKDAPSVAPSLIINIKKEKQETEEETKEILRSLERDNVSPTVVSHLH